MRFLAVECLSARIVGVLREQGHDVRQVRDIQSGEDDEAILERSLTEQRILVIEDWDFGELVVRSKKPAVGVIIVGIKGTREEIARHVAIEIAELGQNLIGKLTLMEAGRTRQRGLAYLGKD